MKEMILSNSSLNKWSLYKTQKANTPQNAKSQHNLKRKKPTHPKTQKANTPQNAKSQHKCAGFSKLDSGGDLLSHTKYHAVPSALKSLTTEFGMGSGVTSSLRPPKIEVIHSKLSTLQHLQNTLLHANNCNTTLILTPYQLTPTTSAAQANRCSWQTSLTTH